MSKPAYLIVTLVLLVVTGCGSDDPQPGSDPRTSEPTTESVLQVDPSWAVVETGETLQIDARIDGVITNRLTFTVLHENHVEASRIGTVSDVGLYSAPGQLTDPPVVRVRVESALVDDARFVEVDLVLGSGLRSPRFSEPEGVYEQRELGNGVRLETSTPGATIYYTLDGSAPVPDGAVYVSPIEVSSTMTIRAMVQVPGRGSSSPVSSTYVIPGDTALAFSLPDLAGRTQSLSDHRGEVVLVDFWATWCGPCVQSMPKLQEYRDTFASRGLEVFAISIDRAGRSRESSVEQFLRDHSIDLNVLLDEERQVADAWSIRAIPTAILIDRNGRIVLQKVGYVSGQDISEIIRVCLAG